MHIGPDSSHIDTPCVREYYSLRMNRRIGSFAIFHGLKHIAFCSKKTRDGVNGTTLPMESETPFDLEFHFQLCSNNVGLVCVGPHIKS